MNKDVKNFVHELEAAGFEVQREGRSGGHARVLLGDRFITGLALTPSDHRWHRNLNAELRRMGFDLPEMIAQRKQEDRQNRLAKAEDAFARAAARAEARIGLAQLSTGGDVATATPVRTKTNRETWTKENVEAALALWVEEHGSAPVADQWKYHSEETGVGYTFPTYDHVRQFYPGGWRALLATVGEHRPQGRRVNSPMSFKNIQGPRDLTKEQLLDWVRMFHEHFGRLPSSQDLDRKSTQEVADWLNEQGVSYYSTYIRMIGKMAVLKREMAKACGIPEPGRKRMPYSPRGRKTRRSESQARLEAMRREASRKAQMEKSVEVVQAPIVTETTPDQPLFLNGSGRTEITVVLDITKPDEMETKAKAILDVVGALRDARARLSELG
jgi:hypothetical protein